MMRVGPMQSGYVRPVAPLHAVRRCATCGYPDYECICSQLSMAAPRALARRAAAPAPTGQTTSARACHQAVARGLCDRSSHSERIFLESWRDEFNECTTSGADRVLDPQQSTVASHESRTRLRDARQCDVTEDCSAHNSARRLAPNTTARKGKSTPAAGAPAAGCASKEFNEVMGCRSASLNRWPGTQGPHHCWLSSVVEIRAQQLGFRCGGIVNTAELLNSAPAPANSTQRCWDRGRGAELISSPSPDGQPVLSSATGAAEPFAGLLAGPVFSIEVTRE